MDNEQQSPFISSYFAYLNKYKNQTAFPVQDFREEREISSLLKKIKDLSGIDFSDNTIDFERYEKLSDKDKTKLLELLMKLYDKTKSKSVLDMIEKVKKELEKGSENRKEQDQNQESTQQEHSSNKNKSANEQTIENKAKNYGDWAFEKFKNKEFSATKKPTLDTRNLDNLSRSQLVSMFRPNVFYSLSNSQKQVLFQAIANDFLRENGISPCAVEMANLPFDSKSICMGEYVPAKGAIYLNKQIFENMDVLDEENNIALPYKILSTIIHEAEHRVQFMNFDKAPKSEAERLLKKSLVEPSKSRNFADYLAEPDEIDARNTALAYVRECANQCTRPEEALALATFYNTEKSRELSNGKSSVSEAVMQENRDVFSNSMLKVPSTMQSQMQNSSSEMYQILSGKGLEVGKTLSRSSTKKF